MSINHPNGVKHPHLADVDGGIRRLFLPRGMVKDSPGGWFLLQNPKQSESVGSMIGTFPSVSGNFRTQKNGPVTTEPPPTSHTVTPGFCI